MSKTIKLIPTNYQIMVGTVLNNPENALTGVDDDSSAELIYSGSLPLGGGATFAEFVGPNGETVADLASKIEHVNSISFKTKYQADSATLPNFGVSVNDWGNSDVYSASSDPQIVEIPFDAIGAVSSVYEYWQSVVEDDTLIFVKYLAAPKASSTAIVNIYGVEMEINYEPKNESGEIDPNSTAEVIYGDTGSSKEYDVEVKDLRVENGKLNGTAVGVAQRSFTGRVDQIKFAFNDVPFDGVGGGSGGESKYEYVTIRTTLDENQNDVVIHSCDKTVEEIDAAVRAGKQIIGIQDFSYHPDDPEYAPEYEHKYDVFPFHVETQVGYDEITGDEYISLAKLVGNVFTAWEYGEGQIRFFVTTFELNPMGSTEFTINNFVTTLSGENTV